MADLFCDSLAGDFIELICGTETGRIVALGLVDPEYVESYGSPAYDPADDTEWTDGEAASPRTHWIINAGVRGEMARATDTTEEGFGLDASQLTGADHQATLQVKGIAGNVDFANKVSLKKWYVALITSADDQDLMYWVDKPCTVIFRPVVGSDIKSSQYWDVTIQWQSITNPEVVVTPDSLKADS